MSEENESEDDLLIPRTRTSEPPDKYNAVYIILFFTGVGTLIPWNFFVTATSYFQFKLRNTSIAFDPASSYKTSDQVMFENYLSLCAMLPNLLFMFINIFLTKCANAYVRFLIGIVLMLLGFSATLILVLINTDSFQDLFFGVTLILVVIVNVGGSFVQGSTFGLISTLPPKNIKATLEGQAVGGVLAAVANIATIALASSPQSSALVYFIIALASIILVGFLFMLLPKINYSRHYFNRRLILTTSGSLSVDISTNPPSDLNSSGEEYFYSKIDQSTISDLSMSRRESAAFSPTLSVFQLFSRLRIPALSVYLVFACSLSLFPAILSRIESTIPLANSTARGTDSNSLAFKWKTTYFIPVVCFLSFNLCDWMGRMLSGSFLPSVRYMPVVFFICIVRLGIIPVLMFANVQPRHHLPVFFTNDAWPIIFIIVLGLTNGYLGTISMIHAPTYSGEGNEERGGVIMSFCLVFGIASGVAISFLLALII